MTKQLYPELNPDLLKSYFPKFDDLPEIDLRVLMWHFLGTHESLISKKCRIKKVDVIAILDRHDPQRTLALNHEMKLAFIDQTVLDIAAALVSTITAEEIRTIKGPEAKLRTCEKLVRLHTMLFPYIPEREDPLEDEDEAGSALKRMKKK